MTPYALGLKEALTTFKVADYADWIARKLVHTDPGQVTADMLAGAGMGGGLGMSVGDILGGAHTKKKLIERIHAVGESGKYPVRDFMAASRDPRFPRLVKATIERGATRGGNIGAAVGGGLGALAGGVPALGDVLRRRALAGKIRNFAPKAALGLGATAVAAGLAHHFLSKRDE
jgi:hypothetical protein